MARRGQLSPPPALKGSLTGSGASQKQHSSLSAEISRLTLETELQLHSQNSTPHRQSSPIGRPSPQGRSVASHGSGENSSSREGSSKSIDGHGSPLGRHGSPLGRARSVGSAAPGGSSSREGSFKGMERHASPLHHASPASSREGSFKNKGYMDRMRELDGNQEQRSRAHDARVRAQSPLQAAAGSRRVANHGTVEDRSEYAVCRTSYEERVQWKAQI
eukprot:CAMPEP_0172025628 /NCGR_PEP_ID=MMETSP1041-20130122/16001_1 /TAXON_ID=464988 /ORGANISM="Hemiselmis andersenii, Strain CCMP439" /LENGTH=217 /DNA_ID=CAMNT_0012681341 /DNA_START=175 /DNA_END=828 /DNA_ORIENTATION=-